MKLELSDHVELDIDPQTAWEFVSDFGGFASWQPHIASVEMQADGSRKVNFTRGDSVFDRVTASDDANHSLTYSIVPGQGGPLASMEATFSVSGGPDRSRVDYTIVVEIPDEMEGPARAGISADIKGALQGLAEKFSA